MTVNDVGKPDPEGFYVIIIDKDLGANVVKMFMEKVVIEDYGDKLIIRTRSRRIAKRILLMSTKLQRL